MATASFKEHNRRVFDGASEDVQLFAANEAARGMSPYVPFRDGILDASVTVAPGKVTYPVDYARYVFYGTDKRFQKAEHPLASAKWHEPYKAAHIGELCRAVGRYMTR